MTHVSRTFEAVCCIARTAYARSSQSPPEELLFAEGPGPILVLHIDRELIMAVYDRSLHGHEKPVTLEFIKVNGILPVRIAKERRDFLAALQEHFDEALSAQELRDADQLLSDDIDLELVVWE